MAYDREQERAKAHQIVNESVLDEQAFTKQDRVRRAVAIAQDEIQEFTQAFTKFVKSVEHLQVFDEMLKKPMVYHTDYLLQSLKHIMEHEYTQEELMAMPEFFRQVILEIHGKKVETLRRIAKNYFAS